MSGSWHVGCRLPDGRRAYADHNDPIVPAIRDINTAIQLNRPKPPIAEQQVAAWLETHAEQVTACLAGSCGHTT